MGARIQHFGSTLGRRIQPEVSTLNEGCVVKDSQLIIIKLLLVIIAINRCSDSLIPMSKYYIGIPSGYSPFIIAKWALMGKDEHSYEISGH